MSLFSFSLLSVPPPLPLSLAPSLPFSLPSSPSSCQDAEELAAILSDDFTRAEFLRDRLVPKAVLFFTGEALEEDDEDVSVK